MIQLDFMIIFILKFTFIHNLKYNSYSESILFKKKENYVDTFKYDSYSSMLFILTLLNLT